MIERIKSNPYLVENEPWVYSKCTIIENIQICPYGLHGCFKSHIAAIKRFFISVRRSGTSLASKCNMGLRCTYHFYLSLVYSK